MLELIFLSSLTVTQDAHGFNIFSVTDDVNLYDAIDYKKLLRKTNVHFIVCVR